MHTDTATHTHTHSDTRTRVTRNKQVRQQFLLAGQVGIVGRKPQREQLLLINDVDFAVGGVDAVHGGNKFTMVGR